MAHEAGAAEDSGMDFLSLLSAVTLLVLVPVGLGLAISALAGDPDDAPVQTLFAPPMSPDAVRSRPIVPEVEHVPWRFGSPQPADAAPGPARHRTIVGRAAPLPH